MPNSLFGLLLVVFLLTVGVVVALGFGVHLYSISELTGGVFGSRLATYSNIDLGLSIRYPSDFTVDTDYTYGRLGHGKDIAGVAFIVPLKKTEGTNLAPDTHISIEVIPSTAACSAGLFLPNVKNIQGVTDHGVSYTFATYEEGAAGSLYEERVYALPAASPCVAVRYFIHSHNAGNYEAGEVEEYDRENLLATFDTMRRSLSIKR